MAYYLSVVVFPILLISDSNHATGNRKFSGCIKAYVVMTMELVIPNFDYKIVPFAYCIASLQ
jgi:hypothetical protein